MKTKNKSFKRLFAFLVALVMVTALVPSVIFAAGPTFTDVKSTDWFYEHVENLAAGNVIGGYPDGTFRPNNPVTRQEAAKMIALGAKTPAASGTEFTDLLGNWADPYIMALEADGAVSGFAGTKEFKPLENIKRGHVAKMIALAFGLKEGSEDYDLTDIKGVDNEEYIKILASNGIVGGFKGTTLFKPNELVTRAQMAKMIDVAMNPVDSTFRVLDVRAINGVTIEVEFSQPVGPDAATVAGEVTIAGVDLDASRAILSKDKKVLTIPVGKTVGEEVTDGEAINKIDAKVAVEPVYLDGSTTVQSEKYVGLLTYKDTVRPTIKAERVNYNTWEIFASEPIQYVGLSAFPGYTTDPDDDYLIESVTTPDDYVKDDLGRVIGVKLTLKVSGDDAATVGEDIEITVNGLKDIAGNLVNPQPTKVKISLAAQDKVAPKIASVTQTGAKTFKIAFDKPATLATSGGVAVGAYAVTEIKAVAGSDTEYTVTVKSTGDNLKGIQTVTVPIGKVENDDGFSNATALSKNVTFTEDKVAPKATAAFVTVDGAQYIQLTFDKDVTEGKVNLTGTKVKDYITTDATVAGIQTDYAVDAAGDDIENVLLVPLTESDLEVEGAVYALVVSNGADEATKVKSEAGYAWAESLNISFTRGKDVDANTTKVTATVAKGASPDKVNVTFSGDVDGATATNKDNYSIDNVVIESAVLNSSTTVTLTLAKNSNDFSGSRNYEFKNIKALGSSVVSGPFTGQVDLYENILPTVVGTAKFATPLDGNYTEIKVTFSENMYTSVAKHLEVYVGTSTTNRATATSTTVDGKIATIKLTGPGITATEVAEGNIRVVVLASAVKDLVGNFAEAVTVTVTE